MTRVVREPHIAGPVVFTNGLPGCGKTMMSPIVGSLKRVELMRYNYHLEHTCVLSYLNLLDVDTASVLIRAQTDLDIYDSMMARETNFRFEDLSSVWKDCRPLRYFRRLFRPGDAAVIPRIAAERPILHLVTHFLLPMSGVLLAALGQRFRMVEVVRHPLYMIKQWHAWMPRPGTDPRIFFLWIEHKGKSIPWFARGWEDLYINSSRMDRVIYSIENQWCEGMKVLNSLPPDLREQILLVPFEQFVVKPVPFMVRLEKLMETTQSRHTPRVMKRQRVPRKMFAEGAALKIYKHYGWEPPGKGSDEKVELEKRRDFAASEASPQALAVLDRLSAEYEAAYLNL